MKIDLRHPEWKSLLASDRAEGTVRWEKGWTDFILAPLQSDGTRNLVLDRTGDVYEPKQCVSLGLRSAGFSSHWFAGCRGCDRWVRTLYAISQSDLFKCRACSGLTYASVQQHDSRLDFARRDLAGFLASRATAPQTTRSRAITGFLSAGAQDPWRPGRGWAKKSVTGFDRGGAGLRREWEDSWRRSFPTLENPFSKSGIDG